MNISPIIFTQFTSWSYQSPSPVQESVLIAEAEIKARQIFEGTHVPIEDQDIRQLLEVATRDNAAKIRKEASLRIEDILNEIAELEKSRNFNDIEESKQFVERVSQQCEDAYRSIVRKYISDPPQLTDVQLVFKVLRKIVKVSLFEKLRNLGKLIQRSKRCDINTFTNKHLAKIAHHHLQLFDLTTSHTRKMILAAAAYCDPPLPARMAENLRQLLNRCPGPDLKPQAMPRSEFNVKIPEFRDNISLQEKFFALLSLVLFFTEIYQVLGTKGRQAYSPERRHLCKALIVRLFVKPDDVYPVNDWAYVSAMEELIGHFLHPDESWDTSLSFRDEYNARCPQGECVQEFTFRPVTQGLYPGTHATIAISGWMSQDSFMEQNWSELIDYMSYGPMYALNYDAGTVEEEIQKLTRETFDAVNIMKERLCCGICEAYHHFEKNGPFISASRRAVCAGKCLAYHIKNRAFGDVSITLACFSLGACVVASCLDILKDEPEKYIEDVILFGGAVSKDGWVERKSAIAGKLINVISKNDSVLEFAYKAAKEGEEPVGLNQINKDSLKNDIQDLDATSWVSSHLDHKVKFYQSMTILKYNP